MTAHPKADRPEVADPSAPVTDGTTEPVQLSVLLAASMTGIAPPPAWPCPTCNAGPSQPCKTTTGVEMGLTHGLRQRAKRRQKRKRL